MLKGLIILFICLAVNLHGENKMIKLPKPSTKSDVSLEETLASRRSVRQYKATALDMAKISQLLWAGQGITNSRNFRTAPSAGATFPLDLYILIGISDTISPGLYRYYPEEQALALIREGDLRTDLAAVALNQPMVKKAPVTIIFSATYSKTTSRYGDRGVMYVHNEVGHAAQNIYLQCETLGLGTVAIGAFDDDKANRFMEFPQGKEVVYMMPVGYVK